MLRKCDHYTHMKADCVSEKFAIIVKHGVVCLKKAKMCPSSAGYPQTSIIRRILSISSSSNPTTIKTLMFNLNAV